MIKQYRLTIFWNALYTLHEISAARVWKLQICIAAHPAMWDFGYIMAITFHHVYCLTASFAQDVIKMPFRLPPNLLLRNKLVDPSDIVGAAPTGVLSKTCCQATSHNMNQWWLLISDVIWHSHENNFTASVQATIVYDGFDNLIFMSNTSSFAISPLSSMDWAKQLQYETRII